MKSAVLEVIGAVVVTTIILGIPVLSFASFIHNWNDFFKWLLFIGLVVDFLYVLNVLISIEEI